MRLIYLIIFILLSSAVLGVEILHIDYTDEYIIYVESEKDFRITVDANTCVSNEPCDYMEIDLLTDSYMVTLDTFNYYRIIIDQDVFELDFKTKSVNKLAPMDLGEVDFHANYDPDAEEIKSAQDEYERKKLAAAATVAKSPIQPESKTVSGWVIGLIIFVIILTSLGLYVWENYQALKDKFFPPPPPEEEES